MSSNGLALPTGNAVASGSGDKAGEGANAGGAVIPGVHGIVPTLQ